MEHEKPAIDQRMITRWLFGELSHAVVLHQQSAVATRRCNGSEGRKLAVLPVERDQSGDIDIGDPVAIGHAKAFVRVEIAANPLQTPARHRGDTSIHQRDPPRFGVVCVVDDLTTARIHRQVGFVQHVVGEILLDHIAAIAKADDEVEFSTKTGLNRVNQSL